MVQIGAHGVLAVSDSIDGLAKFFLAHAEALGPIADLIIFGKADPIAIGGARQSLVVRHHGLLCLRSRSRAARELRPGPEGAVNLRLSVPRFCRHLAFDTSSAVERSGALNPE